jgi:transposase
LLILQTGPVAERVRAREINDDEGRRLVRIVRRGSGSVVTWRRAQMVLLSAQGMDAAAIARVAFTSEDRVRDVIHNFNADGFASLYPRYRGGRAPKFTLGQRREIKKIARSKPAEHDLPFSTWSLSKLAEFLVAEGVVDDISHEGLRALLREEGVTFQRLKTWKTSKDPHYAVKKARIEHLYAIADREVIPEPGEPQVISCVDEFGPLNLQPHPGRQWAAVSGKSKETGRKPRPRMRATYTRTAGVGTCSPPASWAKTSCTAHQAAQEPHPVPGVLPLPALPLPIRRPDRDRLRQLQPAPDHQEGQARRAVGRGKQRRDRLHPDEFILVKPRRGAVHSAAVLRPRRHRPRHPSRTGQHDPPLHHLAQQPRLRRTTPQHHRPGKRSLMRHKPRLVSPRPRAEQPFGRGNDSHSGDPGCRPDRRILARL